MAEILQEIERSLRLGRDLVAVTIVSDKGSTPRTSGSKMIVYTNGRISGTIGGGAIEADVISRALELFVSGSSLLVAYDLSQNTNVQGLDLICGGKMQLLFEYVPANSANLELYQGVVEEIKRCRSFVWVGRISGDGEQKSVERAMQTEAGKWLGPFQPEKNQVKNLEGTASQASKTEMVEVDGQLFVIEAILPPDPVYILGGGHVSKEIASLTKKVGFRTIVIDDRAEFANFIRFNNVDEVRVCPGFATAFAGYSIGINCAIVIVTRGHTFDREVLAQALKTETGYIGMIGSKKKKKSIYSSLLAEGFVQSDLDKVHCPIGLSIDAETPAEIAVSVVAELIKHRAGRKSNG